MGDQIMAIFEGENQADHAVKTAVDIQRAIRHLNERREELGVTTLTVGIGINSGDAVLGNMGSKNRMDYTLIGDVVNLSARLCAIAKPGQIIAPIELADDLKADLIVTKVINQRDVDMAYSTISSGFILQYVKNFDSFNR